ncbi:uncharacterized protein Dwil_GK24548 [Drosophila willistoni]|uniref:Cubilin n=1 Tax=Drosophila willistoni TaxID=7260 RepID=A0A0Q9WSK7_DROWI|nr:uncharacterized protein Dwil_GK24548 [Drosophila willistoni]
MQLKWGCDRARGPTCEDDVNECFDLAGTDLAACQNNAQCINTPGSYRCVCRNGFTGTHCRLRHNACLAEQSKELCGDHGTCIHSNANADGFVCICDQGWTWANTNATVPNSNPCTKDVDECRPDINPCHRDCINLPGSYRCGPCPPGYTGDGKNCRDINECAPGEGSGEENGGCSLQPRVACINTEGSYRCGRCPPGWNGDGRTCKAADSNTCNGEQICHTQATCEMISQTMVCSCREGFYGHGYGPNGCTEDSDRQPCQEHLCQNNGTCVLNGGRGTSCICQPGYTGALCNQSDACHPNPCRNKGTCRLILPNDFTCNCPHGYTDKKCSSLRFYCGSTVRAARGTLRFPPNNEESTYQPDERCPFIIRTTPGSVLNVTFNQFDLQNSTNCKSDFLQLHDGGSLAARRIGTYCGSTLPEGNGTIIATHGQIFFWFLSDKRIEGRGFNLTWSSQPLSCGGEITIPTITQNQSGIIRSPGYPGKAPPRADCRWLITAPFGTRLVLRFFDITLGGNRNTNCSQDSLIIHDADRQIFVACNSIQPSPLYSSSNKLRLDFHTDAHYSDSSFQLHYEAVPGVPGCGGIYTEPTDDSVEMDGFHMNWQFVESGCGGKLNSPEGSIHSPHSGLETSGAVACDWQIVVAQGSTITIRLQSSDLGVCGGQLIIYDGPTTQNRPMRLKCTREFSKPNIDITIRSSTNRVLVRYDVSNDEPDGISFTLDYVTNCKVRLEQMFGAIETPNFPENYPENSNCEWDLRAGDGNNHIQLAFSHLKLDCVYDFTMLQDMQNDQILGQRRLCNHDKQDGPITSEGNRFLLSFSSDFSDSNQGFHAEYKRVGCGEKLQGYGGHLESPNAPYGVDLDCYWQISVPEGKRIRLVINELHIETNEQDCSQDALTVAVPMINGGHNYSSTSVLLRSCQIETSTQTFKSPGNELNVHFRSSKTRARKYFKASYVQLPASCGGLSSSSNGLITSPGFHDQEDGDPININAADLECDWQIQVPNSYGISLQFEYFNLTDSPNCSAAFIELSKLDADDSEHFLERACGDEKLLIRLVHGNKLRVRFIVKANSFGRFALRYERQCGGPLPSGEGYIKSRLDENCRWLLSSPEGSKLSLTILQLECPACGVTNCTNGLTILDDDDEVMLNSFCNTHPVNLIVRANNVAILAKGINFSGRYTNIANTCGGEILSARGTLTTPNYPDSYPENVECVWSIAAHAGNTIELTFSQLDIVKSEHCNEDFLEIRAGLQGQILGLYCDNNMPDSPLYVNSSVWIKFRSMPKNTAKGFMLRWNYARLEDISDCGADYLQIQSSSNLNDWNTELRVCNILDKSPIQRVHGTPNLRLQFVSDASINGTGFVARVRTKCGSNMTGPVGTIASSMLTTNCDWHIEVNAGRKIDITIQYAKINMNNITCPSYGLIYDGLDNAAPLMVNGKFCNRHDFATENYRTSGSHVFIKYVIGKTLVQVPFSNWTLTYREFNECNGEIQLTELANTYNISTPGYPYYPHPHADCTWLVIGPSGETISATFVDRFDLSVRHCEEEFVEIYDGSTQMANRLHKSCIRPKTTIRSTSNLLLIHYQTNLIEPRSGFRLNISLSKCGGVYTRYSDSISSENYPAMGAYPKNTVCTYTIKLAIRMSIQLNITDLHLPFNNQEQDPTRMDSIEIIDLMDMDRVLNVLYGNTTTPLLLPLYTNEVAIRFRSVKNVNNYRGFKLTYERVFEYCSREVNAPSGNLNIPFQQVSFGNRACRWRITVPKGQRVRLELTNLGDIQEVRQNVTSIRRHKCGGVIRMEESIILDFPRENGLDDDDYGEVECAWLLTNSMGYELFGNISLSDSCDREYLVIFSGMLEVARLCRAPANQAIFIDFKYLDLEKSRECHFDELSIYKGSLAIVEQRVARLCGTINTPPTIMVNSNQAIIVVRTDESNSGRGFLANLAIEPTPN